MEKVIGIVRDDHGQIAKLVTIDTERGVKEMIGAGKNAETIFARYPEYSGAMEIVGNRGLVLVDKRGNDIQLVTVAGKLAELTDVNPVIAKIHRLNLRIVNGDIITDHEGVEQLLIQ